MAEDNSQEIQQLQALEQSLQNILYQKQSLQSQLNEITNALEEVKKSKEDPYKIISGVMLKSKKEDIIKELEEKSKALRSQIDSIEKQEKLVEKRSSEIREKISGN